MKVKSRIWNRMRATEWSMGAEILGDSEPATVLVYSYTKWFVNSLYWHISKTLGTSFEPHHCASLL